MGLIASGGVTLAGLEWLGARVYDPAARGFLSTDPLAPVTGAAWAGNPYSYAGNDPLHALDPLGLRPATDADLDAYAHANQGAFAAAGEWWGDNWEYVAAGAAIVAGVALMFTGVGGPAGIALMAASGALLSGGISVAGQKATTGEVDWRRAGIDTAAGALGGGLGAGAGAAVAVRGGSTVARHVAEGAVDGAASSAASYGTSPGPHTTEGLSRSVATGTASSAVSVASATPLGSPSPTPTQMSRVETAEWLANRDVNERFRDEIIDSFTPGTIRARVAGDETFGIRQWGGSSREVSY